MADASRQRRRGASPVPTAPAPPPPDQLQLVAADRIFGGDTAYTPPAVVRQHLDFLALVADEGWQPRTILTPTAGAGAWTREVRARWPQATILACELNPAEAPVLRQLADDVVVGDALDWARSAARRGLAPFDLIADNIPWSNFGEWVEALAPLIAPGGYLQLYGPTQWGQARTTITVVDRFPPIAVGLTGGRVSHHGHGKADALETCSRIWIGSRVVRGATGPLRRRWETYQLDYLERSERRLG